MGPEPPRTLNRSTLVQGGFVVGEGVVLSMGMEKGRSRVGSQLVGGGGGKKKRACFFKKNLTCFICYKSLYFFLGKS